MIVHIQEVEDTEFVVTLEISLTSKRFSLSPLPSNQNNNSEINLKKENNKFKKHECGNYSPASAVMFGPKKEVNFAYQNKIFML